MPRRSSSSQKKSRPATTDESRENQLISLAYDLVEKRMKDGTASATEVTHFLRAGSSRDKLERQKIMNENLFLSAKVDALASAAKIEALYEEAIRAMRRYSGQEEDIGTRFEYDDDDLEEL